MACNCATPSTISSWIDLQSYPPRSPFEAIANAQIVMGGSTDVGVYLNSSTYASPSAWVASPYIVNALPACIALGSDDLQNVADAEMWNFQHLMWNSSSQLAIPLRKIVFVRGGKQWQNNIPISLGGGSYSDLQLGFLDNAATRGDYAGTYPVISWTARAYTGNISLQLTLSQMGQVKLGLRGIDGGGNYSMLEIILIIVP